MSRKSLTLTLVCTMLVCAAFGLYLRTVSIPVLAPHGPVALQERDLMGLTVALCSIVVIPVFFFLFFFAWRYRAGAPHARHTYMPNWDHYSGTVELVWWLVPSLIILSLSYVAWESSHRLDPYASLQSTNAPISIQVVALDWKWLFIYPKEGIASINTLVVPVDTPITFTLTADAPMNSFWIPSLGGQIMVMPGMSTQLNLMASSIGEFRGLSANLSGQGFAGMNFTTHSLSRVDYDRWVRSIQTISHPLTSVGYAQLARPSTYEPATTYAPVVSGLYSSIIMRTLGTHSTP